MTTSTISIVTQDKRVILIKKKTTVSYTVPPPPSEKVDKAFAALKKQDAEYPQLQARRAEFVKQIHDNTEQRLAAIDNALGEVMDLETINNLLEEKAEILDSLEKG